MSRLGSEENPLRLNVHCEARLEEVTVLCALNGWKFIAGINPTEPEDLEDLERKFNPQTVRLEGPQIGRNEPCNCGSGKKFKKCCLNANSAKN